MKILRQFWCLRAAALLACVPAASALAAAATQYVVTNDDPGVSFYSVAQTVC